MHWTELLEQPYDAVEVEIRQVWNTVLNSGPSGASEDFYDLGGDSLAAARIIARLSHRFDLDLPVSAFLSAPTIHELARVIRSRTPVERTALVPIQNGGTRIPLFLVAGAGGYGYYFAGLSRYLGAHQPVFSLQAAELSNRESVATIATQFIATLETVVRDGPIMLGGYCAGGVIVFEMAQQLSRTGRPVGLVAMFDTAFPPGRVDDDYDIDILLEHARLSGLTIEYDRLKAIDPNQRVDMLARAVDAALPAGLNLDRTRWWLQWVRDNVFIANIYSPSQYNGDVVMFHSTERGLGADGTTEDTRIGRWADVSRKLTVVPVPGTHATMFTDPSVAGVAAALQRFLDEVNPVGRILI